MLQTIMVRLVENDFTLLKRFKGKSENDLLAYLAIISRSVVRGCWRHQHARKRGGIMIDHLTNEGTALLGSLERPVRISIELQILAKEVASLAMRGLNAANGFSERDRLIYKLHFLDGLSAAQIAETSGICLTKPGIEKVFYRIIDRVRKMVGLEPKQVCVR